jgi:hypothetical protein
MMTKPIRIVLWNEEVNLFQERTSDENGLQAGK